jgi:hypothetical protein
MICARVTADTRRSQTVARELHAAHIDLYYSSGKNANSYCINALNIKYMLLANHVHKHLCHQIHFCKIWGFHGGDYEECRLLQPPAHAGSSLADFSTVKMEAIHSSETSVQSTRSTWRHIPEDGILQSISVCSFLTSEYYHMALRCWVNCPPTVYIAT